MKRKFTITLIVENDCETVSEGLRKVKEDFKLFKIQDVKPLKVKRTLSQNNALHLWCKQVNEECKEKGLTVEALYKKPAEIKITEYILKDFFRETGYWMYHKDSTTKLEKNEFAEVVGVVEKTWAGRLDNKIPFPSEELFLESIENI